MFVFFSISPSDPLSWLEFVWELTAFDKFMLSGEFTDVVSDVFMISSYSTPAYEHLYTTTRLAMIYCATGALLLETKAQLRCGPTRGNVFT